MCSCRSDWTLIYLFSEYIAHLSHLFSFFFFNDTATTEIYTLSLHDALPICVSSCESAASRANSLPQLPPRSSAIISARSEEHTSELQSHLNLVCRLLLEKKKKT